MALPPARHKTSALKYHMSQIKLPVTCISVNSLHFQRSTMLHFLRQTCKSLPLSQALSNKSSVTFLKSLEKQARKTYGLVSIWGHSAIPLSPNLVCDSHVNKEQGHAHSFMHEPSNCCKDSDKLSANNQEHFINKTGDRGTIKTRFSAHYQARKTNICLCWPDLPASGF